MPAISELKKKVGKYAVDYILKYSGSNKLWIGIGSGTTVHCFIDALGRTIRSNSFNCSRVKGDRSSWLLINNPLESNPRPVAKYGISFLKLIV